MFLSWSKQLIVLSFSFFLKNETNHTFVEINLKQLVCLCCAWHDIIFLWTELDIRPFSLAFVPILSPLPNPLVCWIFCLHLFLIRPFFNTQDSSWLTVPINIINFKAKRNEDEMYKISVEVMESQGRKYLLTTWEIVIWLLDSYAYFIFFNVWSTKSLNNKRNLSDAHSLQN